ncbi:hypothetical protein [Actinoplanes couchii]|uniref:Uncharacterized protein n=1 Tax=Actinoplanes couchii TaxID=403638 RepID=A0ABQ3WZQ1_9ACTN|nr:hypothetical protein [Actinoplanes couchii]MDR6316005.1 hypothetical protein [Actinoplanes couchii]GID51618.1 hypothetical protein Aco03nite_000220 [Actinoplanes couchii]
MATKKEIAVWSVPGESPQQGVVLERGGPRAKVLVEWEGGRQQKVAPDDQAIKFAQAGTRRLQWLLDPELLTKQFADDAPSVFVNAIREHVTTIHTLSLKKMLVDLGLPKVDVDQAFNRSKPGLKINPHLIVDGTAHTWSDAPVDPHGKLRSLSPRSALTQLLKPNARWSREQKAALADAVRAGLPPE